jgi:hypothetical protein
MKNPMFYGRLGWRAVGTRAKGSLGRLALAGGIRLSDGLSQDIANTVRARSFQAVGVRRRGHGRWGVCPALELQIRTADLTGRSCSDELLRGSAEQHCAVEYTTSKTPTRATVSGGEMRQGERRCGEQLCRARSTHRRGVSAGRALRTSYINAFGQHY